MASFADVTLLRWWTARGNALEFKMMLPHRAARYLGRLIPLCLILLVASVASADPEKQARLELQLANEAFAAKRFGEALEHYDKAYRLLPLPGFLFNIGQCHRNLGQNVQAIDAFELYLRKRPKAANRRAVESLLKELRKKPQRGFAPPITPTARPTPGPQTRLPDEDLFANSSRRNNGGSAAVRVVSRRAERRDNVDKTIPFYRSWWFWSAIVAVVAGGAATGAYFATRDDRPDGFVWDYNR